MSVRALGALLWADIGQKYPEWGIARIAEEMEEKVDDHKGILIEVAARELWLDSGARSRRLLRELQALFLERRVQDNDRRGESLTERIKELQRLVTLGCRFPECGDFRAKSPFLNAVEHKWPEARTGDQVVMRLLLSALLALAVGWFLGSRSGVLSQQTGSC